MKMVQEEIRKGPWTEHEDILLVNYVQSFGDRRWDFIAKVSGLNRTGKSCRLRWVNYLHPGLKRGKMSPQEEKLVLELHAKWGNRWSRIARKIPGRTDNEIKNYWRTHMRKKAQEKKRAATIMSPSSSSSNIIPHDSSSSSTTTTLDSEPFSGTTGKVSFFDTGGNSDKKGEHITLELEAENVYYSMDDIWKDIDMSEENKMKPKPLSDNTSSDQEGCNSLSWEYSWDSLWMMDEEETKMFVNQTTTTNIYYSLMGGDHLLTG